MKIFAPFALVLALLGCTSELKVVDENDTKASTSGDPKPANGKPLMLKQCDKSPSNEETITNEVVESVALQGSLIVYGTRKGIFSAPKDLSSPPKMLTATPTESLAIAGQTIYFSSQTSDKDDALKKLAMDGTGEAAVMVDGQPALARYLVSAGDTVYATGHNSLNSNPVAFVYALAADGSARAIPVKNANGIATNGNDVFVTAATSPGTDVYKFAKGAASAEMFFSHAMIDAPFENRDFVANERFLYAVGRDGAARILVRAPVSGGNFAAVTELPDLTNLFADDRDVYIASGSITTCVNRYDEGTNTVQGIHKPAWSVVGADEKHIYYTPLLGLVRLPR